MLQGVDTPQCDEASYVLQDDEFIPHIYDLLRSGYISQHVVDDSKGYVGIITSDIKRLSTLIEAAGKREHQKSKALSDFYESEEVILNTNTHCRCPQQQFFFASPAYSILILFY